MDARTTGVTIKLFNAAFKKPREPRSDEYREGVRSALRDRASQNPPYSYRECPYRLGTAQADAWLAGYHEGTIIWASR